VINCTGFGSRDLVKDDQLIPIRGQIVFLKTENKRRIILEDTSPTYIVYRSDGCVCGGTYEENVFSEEAEEADCKKSWSGASIWNRHLKPLYSGEAGQEFVLFEPKYAWKGNQAKH
jgi:glycine/D-amino acid oxidase-like deaminating enzyme